MEVTPRDLRLDRLWVGGGFGGKAVSHFHISSSATQMPMPVVARVGESTR
jgi:hypothetical protein